MQVSAMRTGNWLKIGKGLAVIGMVSWVSACAPLLDQDFWDEATSFADENYTALGLQQLASGDYASAEKYFDEALRKNPQDGHAMLWRSVLYQNTNRPDRAHDGYETLIAMNPPGTVLMSSATGTQPRPLRDAAEFNLSRLERGLPGSLSINDQIISGPSGLGNGAAAVASGRMGNAPMTSGGMPSAMTSGPVKPMDVPAGAALSAGDEAVAKRFAILRNLQATGLVTPEEYSARRSANLGALLPMSQPSPSAFLNNPPPEGAQVEQRLNQLNRALQIGAITVQEHVAERTSILDALLPAQPRQRATPPPAPQGLMDAARQIARIEDLQQMKLVTPDEFKRERDAIEAAIVEPAQGTAMTLNSGEPVRRVATGESRPVQAAEEMADAAPMAATGSKSVHLASYRNEAQAERGWQILKGRYGQLASLQHGVTRANIPGKGTYYRLMATGLSNSAASSLCADLKRRGQFCEVK
ncbi:tetratricopeptide repeat protein [Thalassospira sp. HF15]|uniref:SPOR domain-containing protein n=1 Tax=Thalassospira sp. HF15 TaxID=2722755 RepID=UPI0014320A84|nr:SPOR domain-containing protein [Thalassospira sp. HF15]NIY74649.1 tetratricopeptide repeat protein [Thalassospira sp. HF15]